MMIRGRCRTRERGHVPLKVMVLTFIAQSDNLHVAVSALFHLISDAISAEICLFRYHEKK